MFSETDDLNFIYFIYAFPRLRIALFDWLNLFTAALTVNVLGSVNKICFIRLFFIRKELRGSTRPPM